MKKGQLLAIGVIAVAIVTGITVLALRNKVKLALAAQPAGPGNNGEQIPDDGSPSAAQVKVIHPRKGALERLCVQPGSVHSFESIQLYAKVPGFLEKQSVDIGDKVKKGDVLAQVFVPDIKAQVERNEAAVAKTQAQLKQMEARVDVAKANLDAAQAAVEQAEATFKSSSAWVRYRKIQLGRMDSLVKDSAVEDRLYDESKERHDASIETENAAKAAISTTKANVLASRAKIKQAEADVVEADAEIRVAKAELKKSQVNLDFATIRAPFDGVITYRSMNPGDFVKAGNDGGVGQPLLTIVRTDKFRVVVLVPDRDVEKLAVGMPTVMRIDSLPDREFYPTVSRIAKALDPRTRLMHVELDVPNDTDGKIYHDMYGQVTIVLDKGKDTLSIPTSCIAGKIVDGKGSAYLIEDGKAKKIDLKLGIDSGLRVVVEGVLTKGVVLTEASEIVIDPTADLARQAEVTATPYDDSPTIQLTRTERQ